MAQVQIFVGAAGAAFASEAEELQAFAEVLNSIYPEHEIRLFVCEADREAAEDRACQLRHNEKAAASDFSHFVIGERVGGHTREELDCALSAYRASGKKPHVYVSMLAGSEPDASTVDFVDHLRDDLGHYPASLANLEQLKLCIVINLLRNTEFGGDSALTFSDGWARLKGRPVINLADVPIYGKNAGLATRKERLAALDAEFAQAASAYAKDADEQALAQMAALDSQREAVRAALLQQEADILAALRIVRDKGMVGSKVDRREAEALQLIGEGRLADAVFLLGDPSWSADIAQSESSGKMISGKVRRYISGRRTLIAALRAQGLDEAGERKVVEIYKEVTAKAAGRHVEQDVWADYAEFLLARGENAQAAEVGRCAEALYELDHMQTQDRARLQALLCRIHLRIGSWERAAEHGDAAVKALRWLAIATPAEYEPQLAEALNELASAYLKLGRMDERGACLQRAEALASKLLAADHSPHAPLAAQTYNRLAVHHKRAGELELAERYHTQALELRRELCEHDAATYEPELCESYNNLGILLKKRGELVRAEECYLASIETRRKLAVANPVRYAPKLAVALINYAELLLSVGCLDEAEACANEAIQIRNAHAGIDASVTRTLQAAETTLAKVIVARS